MTTRFFGTLLQVSMFLQLPSPNSALSTRTSIPYDVLVYGSTPSGIIAAIAASRNGAKTALVSQRKHIGIEFHLKINNNSIGQYKLKLRIQDRQECVSRVDIGNLQSLSPQNE